MKRERREEQPAARPVEGHASKARKLGRATGASLVQEATTPTAARRTRIVAGIGALPAEASPPHRARARHVEANSRRCAGSSPRAGHDLADASAREQVLYDANRGARRGTRVAVIRVTH